MIDTKITVLQPVDDYQEYDVELSINLQHDLGLYIEPIPGKPETYEDEHKSFNTDMGVLEDLVDTALEKMKLYQQDVFKCMGYEAAGLTYKQVTTAITGKNASDDITDKPYGADEDLVFLYGMLQILADFVYEVKCLDEWND